MIASFEKASWQGMIPPVGKTTGPEYIPVPVPLGRVQTAVLDLLRKPRSASGLSTSQLVERLRSEGTIYQHGQHRHLLATVRRVCHALEKRELIEATGSTEGAYAATIWKIAD